ncbi:hypothetical protein HPB51_024869 [Rhipicephalus microplus]|uniref:Tick transposon n=1 Tax=Rhipicephalus microplus TaxID=6941 RepID=A0A9J6F9X7_RHIMP|nr:hypothetical protein HPB51_024869 [Rhipicephalus microplus]
MYRDILRLRLKTTGSENAWAHFSRIINRTTEFLWNHVLPGLRQSLRKKTPVPKSQVKVIGNTTLPDNIREVLELGPKFAVEPKKSAPELLGMVRQVSKQVPDAESDRGPSTTCVAAVREARVKANYGGGRVSSGGRWPCHINALLVFVFEDPSSQQQTRERVCHVLACQRSVDDEVDIWREEANAPTTELNSCFFVILCSSFLLPVAFHANCLNRGAR